MDLKGIPNGNLKNAFVELDLRLQSVEAQLKLLFEPQNTVKETGDVDSE